RCWVQKNTAGTTFHLTQPFSPLAIPVQFAAPVEVDTFATGDDFILFQKTRINFAELLPTVVDANASFNNLLQVFNCVAVDLSGVTGGGGLQSNASTVFAEAQIERGLLLVPTLGVTGTQGVYNCVGRVSSGVPGLNIQGYTAQVQNANVAQPYNIVGGCVAFCGVDSGVLLDGDVIVSANPCAFAGGLFGLVCVDSGAKLVMTGNTDWRTAGNTFFGSCIGWGAGTIDVFGRNTCALTANAATQFPSAGFVMRLNAGTVADSHTGAVPDVFNGGITISPANLNAAAGAAGFGGEAFVVSGAAYRMNTL